jgi:hypothetical protein
LNFLKTQKKGEKKTEKKKNRKKKKDATGPAQHPPWGARHLFRTLATQPTV